MTQLPTILDAIKFATLKHDGQRRKLSNEPYITHPIRVAQLAEEYVHDEDKFLWPSYAIVAILHDTLEDTETLYQELVDNFGDWVAKSVFALTNPPKEGAEKRAEYKKRIHARLSSEFAIIKTLKMCDRLDNLRSMKKGAKKWRDKYCEETRDLLRNIGDGNRVLADIILAEVEELEALKV